MHDLNVLGTQTLTDGTPVVYHRVGADVFLADRRYLDLSHGRFHCTFESWPIFLSFNRDVMLAVEPGPVKGPEPAFKPQEVAYRARGLAWKRKTLKTQRAFDKFMDKAVEDGLEVMTRDAE